MGVIFLVFFYYHNYVIGIIMCKIELDNVCYVTVFVMILFTKKRCFQVEETWVIP